MWRMARLAPIALALLGAAGCGAKDNESAFAGQKGGPAPDVPATQEEYDRKFQEHPDNPATPLPTTKTKAKTKAAR